MVNDANHGAGIHWLAPPTINTIGWLAPIGQERGLDRWYTAVIGCSSVWEATLLTLHFGGCNADSALLANQSVCA